MRTRPMDMREHLESEYADGNLWRFRMPATTVTDLLTLPRISAGRIRHIDHVSRPVRIR